MKALTFAAMHKKEGVCLDHKHGAEGKEIWWGGGDKGGKTGRIGG